ncbi:MAG: phospholipase [Paludibacteraceae bacterium]
MLFLIGILLFFGLLLFLLTYLNRRNETVSPDIVTNEDPECCGAHEVCDKDTLLSAGTKPEYFDDEELDVLAGKAAETFTEWEENSISEIFYSLPEDNIAPWLRSLQIRNIQLPESVKEQALMVVGERREKIS